MIAADVITLPDYCQQIIIDSLKLPVVTFMRGVAIQ
jgi:hypothetical protein